MHTLRQPQRPVEPENDSTGWRRTYALAPVFVLAAGFGVAVVIAQFMARADYEAAQARFEGRCARLTHDFQMQLATCEAVLLSASSLLSLESHSGLTRQEWRAHCEHLRPEDRLPGVQGLGFAEFLRPGEVAGHEARVRAEGFAGYSLKPAGNRAAYSAIVYLEPFRDRNLRAFGFDMLSEPVRRAAMETAADLNSPTASGPVRLVQEIAGAPMQHGFLVYVPVYRQDRPLDSPADRRAALRGWAYAPVRAGDFVNSVQRGEFHEIAVTLRDGTAGGAGLVLHDSNPTDRVPSPRHRHSETVEALGRRWELSYSSRPNFELGQQADRPRLVLLLGGICSALAAAVTASLSRRARDLGRQAELSHALARAKDELEHNVEERTAQLSEANRQLEDDIAARRRAEDSLRELTLRFRTLLQVASDGVHILDDRGHLREHSESFRHMLGYEPHEMAGLTVHDWDVEIPPDELLPRVAALMIAPAVFRTRHRRRDGRTFPVEINARGVELGGQMFLYASSRDISAQVRAVSELQAAAHYARSLIEAAPDPMVLLDAGGRVTDLNRSFSAATGRTREELLGADAARCFTDPPTAAEVHRQVLLEGRARSYTLRLRHRSGAELEIDYQATALRDAGGGVTGILASARDATERNRIQRELEGERQRLASIIEGTNVGTWEWNVQTGELRVNERWAQIVGYTAEELAPVSIDTWLRLGHPDDLRQSEELLQAHFRGESSHYDCTCRMRRKDGGWSWVHDRGKVVTRTAAGAPLMMFGTHADVTAQREVEEALRSSEESYRLQFEGNTTVMLLIRPEDGLIADANAAAVRFYGHPREALTRMRIQELNLRTPAEVSAAMQSVAPNATNRFHFQHRLADGSVRDVSVSSTRIQTRRGALLHSIVVDETETLRLQQQTEEHARRLRELLREVNHRVTNNLASIQGLIAAERMAEAADSPAQPVLRRLSARIGSLLGAHRLLSSTEWAPVRVDALARTIIQAALAAMPAGRTAAVEVGGAPVTVSPRQASNLALILNELATNSAKHCAPAAPALAVTLAVAEDPETLTVTYADNGPGFPPAVLAGGGGNVGLALVRQLTTETLRGELTLANGPGAITTIRIRREDLTRT